MELEQLCTAPPEPRGVAEESERTYVEIRRVRDLLTDPNVDWSTLGMIFLALSSSD
jgi:hypothetical protein